MVVDDYASRNTDSYVTNCAFVYHLFSRPFNEAIGALDWLWDMDISLDPIGEDSNITLNLLRYKGQICGVGYQVFNEHHFIWRCPKLCLQEIQKQYSRPNCQGIFERI